MRLNPLHKDHDNDAISSENPSGDVTDGTTAGRHSAEPEESGGVMGPVDEPAPSELMRPAGGARPADTREPAHEAASAPHDAPTDAPTRTDVATTKRRIAPQTPQFGAGLCGFLTAVGGYLVVVAVVRAVVTRMGSGAALHVGDALDGARLGQVTGVHWNGAIALLVLSFLALLVGGYTCGTMARAHGALEGLSVWLWAAVAAVVASLIIEFSSSKYAVLYQFDLFPRIHIGSLTGTATAIISAIVIAAAGLLGALLGGMIGAASHRRVHVLETASRSRW